MKSPVQYSQSHKVKSTVKRKYVKYTSQRPTDCPLLWCGCWLSKFIFGENKRDLWVAKNWLKFPKTTPRPGAVAVFNRKGGGGHVGVVQSLDKNGNPIVKSGNHSNRVATATYSKSNVIAYATVN